MRTTNSFGIHFILRLNKEKNGSAPVYARISVVGKRIEMSLRKLVKVTDWNSVKGLGKPKSVELKTLNNYLEQTRGMLSGIYQELSLTSELITPNLIKNRFLGVVEDRLSVGCSRKLDKTTVNNRPPNNIYLLIYFFK